MDKIYQDIWKLAKPYYLKGRPMDVDHIAWMMKEVIRLCELDNLDISLLLPLAILHDVGYSALVDPKTANYYDVNTRKFHMEAGKDIAEEILNNVNYPEDKSKKICHYVSIHDNWAFGEVDIYMKDKILGVFKDLDYLWIFYPKGFEAIRKVLKKNTKEMIEHLKAEASPIGGKKPFSTENTKKLHDEYLKEIEAKFS